MHAEAAPAAAPQTPAGVLGRPFVVLFLAGMTGIATLPFALLPHVRELVRTEEIPIPAGVVAALATVQPTLLLAFATLVGLKLAPGLGLRSHLAAWAGEGVRAGTPLRRELPLALGLGVAAALAVLLLDPLLLPASGSEAPAREPLSALLLAALSGVLYGGITEELMMRWGLLSALAWGAWKLLQRDGSPPRPAVMWSALAISAVLFGLGHLGAVAAEMPLTPLVVFRTVLLNALGGTVFGWLFWRRSLEAAMAAHAMGHVVFLVARLVA